ncbi:MAG TPA: 30S ribosome-binding factor RbfA [Saprospiraceae bacterium]|nr:30S ribosome-binding factor RbfA [Saprospiraceae bacterium]HNT21728.1 30S ribosome-binding factor RbfA [Saprospiraceae bacterium]
MESKRQQQVAELILRNFSYVLQQEGLYIYGREPLVTVTSVKVASDLQLARIYLSIYNTENKEAILGQIREHDHKLKQEMYHRLKKQLRRMPALEYFIDETLDEMYRVEALFQRLEGQKQAPGTGAGE